MTRLVSILFLASSFFSTLFAETGMPIRVWIMPTSARYGELLREDQLEQALYDFRSEWEYLLDLSDDEYNSLLRGKPQMLYDLLGQTNVLHDIRTTFNDETRGTGVLEDGAWYPLKVRLSVWEWERWLQQIQEAEISNRPPDLMEIGTTWVPYLAEKGMIIRLSDLVGSNAYHHGLLQALQVRDRLYAYPRQVDIRVLFSNADKIGRFAQPTWHGLQSVLGRDKPFAMPELDQNAFHTFAALVYSRGIEMLRVDSDSGHIVPAGTNDLENAFSFFRRLGTAFQFLPSKEPPGYSFAKGGVAATVGGADFFLHLQNESADTSWHEWVQVHPLPPCLDGLSHVWLGGSGLAISKWYEGDSRDVLASKQRRRAIERIAEGFTRIAPLALHVACPADNALRKAQFFKLGSPGAAYLAIVDESLPRRRFVSYPPHPGLVEYETGSKIQPLIKAMRLAIRGDARAVQGLLDSWHPVREALMTREVAIIISALGVIAVLLMILIGVVIKTLGNRALQVESEALDAFMVAALSPYIVAICRKDAASIPGQKVAGKMGYGTLIACKDGRTVLLTACHLLDDVDFERYGMTIRTLDGRVEVDIPAGAASVRPYPSQGIDAVVLVESALLRALPGFGVTARETTSSKVYGMALQGHRPIVFRGSLQNDHQGLWSPRSDETLPCEGDSGMGLFDCVVTNKAPQVCLAAIFLGKGENAQIFHASSVRNAIQALEKETKEVPTPAD